MSNMQTLSLHQKTKKNFKNERVMAITEENIRGKIGNSIFYRVGSVTRVRSAASKYTDANTSKQRESRSRLRVAIRFYRRLAGTELRKRGIWQQREWGKVGIIYFEVEHDDFKPDGDRDFARLQLTVGRLQKVNHLVVRVDEGDAVSMEWEREGIFLLREKRINWWLLCFMAIVRFLRNLSRRAGR